MSGLVGAALPTNIDRGSDQRINRMDFQPETMFADVWAIAPASFETPWWPKGGGFIGDGGTDVGLLEASWWGEYDQAGGAASRFGFAGVTRDQYGSILPSCDVKLFRTADSLLIDSAISDPTTGAFLLNSDSNQTTHWIYQHKAGSPDLDGVSVNTLLGT